MKNNTGVTLVELLVVVAVFVILAATSVQVYFSFQKKSELTNSVEELVSVLRLSRNKTMASETASNFGVHFESVKFVLFRGTSYNPSATDNEIHNLSKRVEIYEINLSGGGAEVIFNRVTGETNQTGTISLRLKDDVSQTETAVVYSSGEVTTSQESLPDDAARIKDSRHVHFNLDWSIQNATNLKFYFSALSQTEIIPMIDYFNFDKTAFDWEGKFSVGGTDQVFQIKTHSLDSFSAVLSVHRDRNQGKNNQEVRIYIVDNGIDKEIAHYLANPQDAVEKGTYVNTMEIQ